jgi:hypothetical protein
MAITERITSAINAHEKTHGRQPRRIILSVQAGREFANAFADIRLLARRFGLDTSTVKNADDDFFSGGTISYCGIPVSMVQPRETELFIGDMPSTLETSDG